MSLLIYAASVYCRGILPRRDRAHAGPGLTLGGHGPPCLVTFMT